MKILLISVENTLVCFGVRSISACLKEAGHTVECLFLTREFDQLETSEEIERIADWVYSRNPELIGISLMSSHLKRVLPIQGAIKARCNCPIVWGGIHPTIRPEECLEFVDIVCLGEGEAPMVELADSVSKGEWPCQVPNIWYKENDRIAKAPVRDRKDNLDDLPYPDHDALTQYIHIENEIRHPDQRIWEMFVPGFTDTHYVMSSRGCPHNCTYCCNSALRKVTCGPYLRRRSPEHFVGEMEQIKESFPKLKGFVFMDDSFFYGDAEWFENFCCLYKERIDLPFFCWANPIAVTEDRIKPLADVGLVGVHVGLESGSERVAEEIYKRKVSQEVFYKCMDILHKYHDKVVDVRVDVITDNPYETEDDVAETVRVLSHLKKPFFVGIVSLIFYPQTELEQRARAEGLLTGKHAKLYDQEFFEYKPTFLNRLMRTIPFTPGSLVRFFLNNRKSLWCQGLFYLYYFGYFVGFRRRVRAFRRITTLWLFKQFGHRFSPRKVVTTRVTLIDF